MLCACLLSDWFSLTDSWDVPPLSLWLRLRLWWLYPRILGVITRPGTSESLSGSWHSWQESGTSSILVTSSRSEWSEDQRKQMSWDTASAEIDVQADTLLRVSVTPQHSQPISEWLRASKYSRCISDLLFTLYRILHHNLTSIIIPRNVFILIIRSANCVNIFASLYLCIFQNGSVY